MASPPDPSETSETADYRMEYAVLMSAYASAADMYWKGYSAFFAVNTLLATGITISYSVDVFSSSATFLKMVQIGLPIIGMSMSLIAIYAAAEIRKHQAVIANRGRVIDTHLATESFTLLPSGREGFPFATAFGSLLFLLAWAGVLLAAL